MLPKQVFQFAALSLFIGILPAQDLDKYKQEFEKRVTEFTLDNGMKFIVLERHNAPVVSFNAHVNVGSAHDPTGSNNLAHMFEHMIAKGTRTVGSTDWEKEREFLVKIEQLQDQIETERAKGASGDKNTLQQLESSLKQAIEQASAFVDPNAYVREIEKQGAVGFNASTAPDYTNYYYSLPTNRAELWFLLSSEFFKHPVFREFYKERDVVREEHRMRVESNPQGKLFQKLFTTAFVKHPYRDLMGIPEEIETLRAKDAQAFFEKYYAPGNVTVTIVGDVKPAEMKRLAEKYFGSIPKRPVPPPLDVVEPPQKEERRAVMELPAQPILFIGYKRPGVTHKDDSLLDVVASILSSGRTGILYKDLVRDKRVAMQAGADSTVFPTKDVNMFLVYAVPAAGKTVEENEKVIYEALEKLKTEAVDAETLERVKTKLKAGVIRGLDSNAGLAQQLALYEVYLGDWRELFDSIDRIEAVTAADVQRAAREYFRPDNRTVVYNINKAAAAAKKETAE